MSISPGSICTTRVSLAERLQLPLRAAAEQGQPAQQADAFVLVHVALPAEVVWAASDGRDCSQPSATGPSTPERPNQVTASISPPHTARPHRGPSPAMSGAASTRPERPAHLHQPTEQGEHPTLDRRVDVLLEAGGQDGVHHAHAHAGGEEREAAHHGDAWWRRRVRAPTLVTTSATNAAGRMATTFGPDHEAEQQPGRDGRLQQAVARAAQGERAGGQGDDEHRHGRHEHVQAHGDGGEVAQVAVLAHQAQAGQQAGVRARRRLRHRRRPRLGTGAVGGIGIRLASTNSSDTTNVPASNHSALDVPHSPISSPPTAGPRMPASRLVDAHHRVGHGTVVGGHEHGDRRHVRRAEQRPGRGRQHGHHEHHPQVQGVGGRQAGQRGAGAHPHAVGPQHEVATVHAVDQPAGERRGERWTGWWWPGRRPRRPGSTRSPAVPTTGWRCGARRRPGSTRLGPTRCGGSRGGCECSCGASSK